MNNLKGKGQTASNAPSENKEHKELEDSIQKLQEEFKFFKQQKAELRVLQNLTPQTNLMWVEVNLVEHCNLNCFCCNHFSQLADEEYTDLKSYEKDIKQLALVCGGGGRKSLSLNGR